MSSIISDLTINGNLDLIKILYNSGIYPDRNCINYAIDGNHINIIEWLVEIKFEINETHLYDCIKRDRLIIFKKIFNECYNLNVNSIFNYVILSNKIFFITFIYLNYPKINIDNIFCAFQTKNKIVIEWILDALLLEVNDYKFYYLLDLVKEKYKEDKYILNLIHNYFLINKLQKKKNEISIFIDLNSYLLQNKNIELNVILKYDKFIYPVLLSSFLTINMNSIFNILEKQKVMCNLDSLIDDIILLHNRYILQIKNTQVINFFISFELFNKVDSIKYYSNEYRRIIFNKVKDKFYESGYLVYHKINFDHLKNEPLVYNTWDEAIEDNKHIYIDNINYGYIIDELLKHWKSNLNAYNYGIVPKYPTNPYTGQLIKPIELYRIIIYAIVENIKIPFIVRFFAKHPQIVLNSFNKFNQTESYKNENSYYLKDLFLQSNLVYLDSVAENNEGGKWRMDALKETESFIFLYNMINISYEIGILLFYYIWKNVI